MSASEKVLEKRETTSSGEPSSVMRLLFENGEFDDILEDIFFRLHPKTILACALVCQKWHGFIRTRVWSISSGERRITHNWIHKAPTERRVELIGTERPRLMVANRDFIVVAFPRGTEIYDRRTFLHVKRLMAPTRVYPEPWRMSMSSRYLLLWHGLMGSHVEKALLFRVRDGFDRVPMVGMSPMDLHAVENLRMTSEDTLIVEDSLEEEMSVSCYRISQTTLRYDWEWRVDGYAVLNADRSNMILGRREEDGRIGLRLHSLADGGKLLRRMEFEPGNIGRLLSVACAGSSFGVVLADRSFGSTSGKIFLCDLECGLLVGVTDCWPSSGLSVRTTMWCDASAGVLLVADDEDGIVSVWDLRALASSDRSEEEEEASPVRSRVIATGGPEVVPSGSRLILTRDAGGGKTLLVECDFWGRM